MWWKSYSIVKSKYLLRIICASCWCDFRSNVQRSADLSSQITFGVDGIIAVVKSHVSADSAASQNVRGGKAKVADLDVVVWVDENVDGFQISMDHGLSVNVKQSFKDLLKGKL